MKDVHLRNKQIKIHSKQSCVCPNVKNNNFVISNSTTTSVAKDIDKQSTPAAL